MLEATITVHVIHKIAGRTSMIPIKATMTTQIQKDVVADISSPNSPIRFNLHLNRKISALVWSSNGSGDTMSRRGYLLGEVLRWIRERHSDWALWLVATHGVWQPDNRIVRYNKLWRSFEKRGFKLPSKTIPYEGLRVEAGELRFFGACEIDPEHAQVANRLATDEWAEVVIGSRFKIDPVVAECSRKGWDVCARHPSCELIDCVCAVGGCVISLFGDFDDAEVSVAILGSPADIDSL